MFQNHDKMKTESPKGEIELWTVWTSGLPQWRTRSGRNVAPNANERRRHFCSQPRATVVHRRRSSRLLWRYLLARTASAGTDPVNHQNKIWIITQFVSWKLFTDNTSKYNSIFFYDYNRRERDTEMHSSRTNRKVFVSGPELRLVYYRDAR